MQQFAPNQDLGQDGLIEMPYLGKVGERRMVIQSKHTSQPGTKISLSTFAGEIDKLAKLASSNPISRYILVTNCNMTVASRTAIITRLKKSGVGSIVVIERTGLERQIRGNPRLRAKVPRLYGIGDLSAILDERRIEQSRAILEGMAPDLATFVPTHSYRQAVEVLNEHHMVILLGDPASGKTTIANCLIVGSIDQSAGEPIVVKSFKEIRDHWKPGESARIFYFDDFLGWGSTIWSRVYELNDNVDFLKGAMKSGCRFIFTSRNYVWQEALLNIKLHQLVALRSGQVAIDLQALTVLEKAQILFNHLKHGDQSSGWRADFQDYYKQVVLDQSFTPECARRMGRTEYTKTLMPDAFSVRRFVRNQGECLIESIKGLTSELRGALAAVYMSGGLLVAARKEYTSVQAAMDLYGLNLENIRTAFGAMKDVFVKENTETTQKGWIFKHPTIREALASIVKDDPDLIEIAVRGSSLMSLLHEAVCEGVTVKGARLVIPESLYDELVRRIRSETAWNDWVSDFLTDRASASFRKLYFDGLASLAHPIIAANLNASDRACKFMSILDREAILDPAAKLAFVSMLNERAASLECSDFPMSARAIMTTGEFDAAIASALATWEADLEAVLEHHADEWSDDIRPESYYEGLVDRFSGLLEAAGGELTDEARDELWDRARPFIEDLEERYVDPDDHHEPEELVAPSKAGPEMVIEAEIEALFSDVAA